MVGADPGGMAVPDAQLPAPRRRRLLGRRRGAGCRRGHGRAGHRRRDRGRAARRARGAGRVGSRQAAARRCSTPTPSAWWTWTAGARGPATRSPTRRWSTRSCGRTAGPPAATSPPYRCGCATSPPGVLVVAGRCRTGRPGRRRRSSPTRCTAAGWSRRPTPRSRPSCARCGRRSPRTSSTTRSPRSRRSCAPTPPAPASCCSTSPSTPAQPRPPRRVHDAGGRVPRRRGLPGARPRGPGRAVAGAGAHRAGGAPGRDPVPRAAAPGGERRAARRRAAEGGGRCR